jgi:hypothetical protein
LRQIANEAFLIGEHSGGEDRQRGVFVAGDEKFPLQFLPAGDDKSRHIIFQRGQAATKQVYDKNNFPTDGNNATDEKQKYQTK